VDDIIKWASKRLAGETSRRGFVSTLGKLAVGAAGLITASAFPRDTEAAQLQCCTGAACSSGSRCPSGTTVGYTWSCGKWLCNDCLDSSNNYVCTYKTHS
jgi:hypothetical protein